MGKLKNMQNKKDALADEDARQHKNRESGEWWADFFLWFTVIVVDYFEHCLLKIC